MTIQSNRTLGGVGALLTLVGVVSQVLTLVEYGYPASGTSLALSAVSGLVGVLGLVGFILFLIAMYGFSKDYREERIFNYVLYGLILAIVAALIAVIVIFVVVFSSVMSLIPTLNSPTTPPSEITSAVMALVAPFFPVFGVIGLIYVLFNVRAFNLLADKSKVPLFKTGALVLLAGTLVTIALSIVFAVVSSLVSLTTLSILVIPGGLVQDAAWVVLARAFFRITPPPTPTLTSPNVPIATGQVKYCPNCGAQNQPDATYCTRCGQKL